MVCGLCRMNLSTSYVCLCIFAIHTIPCETNTKTETEEAIGIRKYYLAKGPGCLHPIARTENKQIKA